MNGQFLRTESGRSYKAKASKGFYAHICRASRKDFRNAVSYAQKAFGSWESKMSFDKGQILYRMAELLEGRKSEIHSTLMQVSDVSSEHAQKQVQDAIDALVYFSGFADKFQQVLGAVNPVAGPHHNFTTIEPVGVSVLVPPEELDLEVLFGHMASLLVAGNTVIVLLPENWGAFMGIIGEAASASHIPSGVLNLLGCHFEEIFPFVTSHMEVQLVDFQRKDSGALEQLRIGGAENMKRIIEPLVGVQSLEPIMRSVEFKTVWHPVGV